MDHPAAVEQAVSHLAELAHLQPPALWEMITCQLLGPLWTQRTSSYASAWHSSIEATPDGARTASPARRQNVFDLHSRSAQSSGDGGGGGGDAGGGGGGNHAPLRLTYHGRNHYNVLFDPNEPDVGVGLGLPGLQPGLADAMQMNSALEASEQEGLEAELLKQAQADSEMEEAQAAIEAAVRAESAAAGGGGGGGGEHSGAPLAAAAGNPAVQQLLAMGFALPRAVQAFEIFGNDLDSCLEFLTAD